MIKIHLPSSYRRAQVYYRVHSNFRHTQFRSPLFFPVAYIYTYMQSFLWHSFFRNVITWRSTM